MDEPNVNTKFVELLSTYFVTRFHVHINTIVLEAKIHIKISLYNNGIYRVSHIETWDSKWL